MGSVVSEEILWYKHTDRLKDILLFLYTIIYIHNLDIPGRRMKRKDECPWWDVCAPQEKTTITLTSTPPPPQQPCRMGQLVAPRGLIIVLKQI